MSDEQLNAYVAKEMTIDALRDKYPLSEKCIDDLDDAIITAAKKGEFQAYCGWDDKSVDRYSVETAARYFNLRGFVTEIIYGRTQYKISVSWYV